MNTIICDIEIGTTTIILPEPEKIGTGFQITNKGKGLIIVKGVDDSLPPDGTIRYKCKRRFPLFWLRKWSKK